VVTYEHLALPLLARVDAHPDALHKLVIHYPEPTLVAHHPMIFFHASTEQTDAAQRWLKFLLSEPMQQKAIEAGFRPVSPGVTIRGYNVESNLFLRLRRYGVFVQPRLTEAPRPEANEIRELINLWGEATGRN
jgi:ABC-type Fe3+ transport system substrate-binding protein